MKARTADLRGDMDSIRTDIEVLQTDVAAALRDLVTVSRAEAGELKDKLEGQLRERLANLSEKADGLAKRGRKAVASLESVIEEKPIQSVGIALGVGLVIGALLARK